MCVKLVIYKDSDLLRTSALGLVTIFSSHTRNDFNFGSELKNENEVKIKLLIPKNVSDSMW